MNKAVYIGAGTDLVPVIVIDDIKEFIYIDSQPFSEFGTHAYDETTHISSYIEKKDRHENAFSRKSFLEKCFLMTFFLWHYSLKISHDENRPYFSAN